MLPLLLLFPLLFVGCHGDEEEVVPLAKPTSVIKVEGPATAVVGESVALEVYFVVANGCGQLGSFGTTTLDSVVTIAVYPVYAGQACTLNLPTRKAIYTYTPVSKGTHTLKFWRGINDYIVKQIEVQ